MHVVVRIFRTIAFLAVVLPNARTPGCYARRFPPVPEDMVNYVWTGASTLKGFGGCNDLVLRYRPQLVIFGRPLHMLVSVTAIGSFCWCFIFTVLLQRPCMHMDDDCDVCLDILSIWSCKICCLARLLSDINTHGRRGLALQCGLHHPSSIVLVHLERP